MNTAIRIRILLTCALALGCAACMACRRSEVPATPAARSEGKPNSVFVSIVPQKYFVERVGGDRVSVEVLVGPGQSPATYSPPPKQLARLADADVYFRIGVPFERQLADKIEATFQGLRIVDTHEGIQRRSLPHHEHAEHAAGDHGAADAHQHAHDEAEPDPHIWLDPQLVKTQARAICDVLKEIEDLFESIWGYTSLAGCE